jgi:hypothetical protein
MLLRDYFTFQGAITMGRILASMLVLLAAVQTSWGQDKATDKAADKDKDITQKATELMLKIRRDAYPQPFNERLAISIENASPLEIAYDPQRKQDVGSKMKFNAVMKNNGKEDFPFIPMDFDLYVVTDKGEQIPHNAVVWNEMAHGDTGTYDIKPGKGMSKPVELGIGDFSVKIGSKYFVVLVYSHLYKEPVPATDTIVTVLPVEVVKASDKPAK